MADFGLGKVIEHGQHGLGLKRSHSNHVVTLWCVALTVPTLRAVPIVVLSPLTVQMNHSIVVDLQQASTHRSVIAYISLGPARCRSSLKYVRIEGTVLQSYY